MTSQTLREARKYEEAFGNLIQAEERPDFHLSPRVGWMNDPNGFSYYNGQYHMFYQYHPYAPYWGPMHWGHAVSEDLLHWDYLPAALAPDELYDKDGCFSGSAVTLPDGQQLLMYTAVREEHLKDGSFRGVQTQCLAVGDGVDYEKYSGNPVLSEVDLPKGSSRFDFRDPKIWRTAEGTYRCLLGSRPADGSGQLLLYASEDGFHWNFKKIFVKNENRYGKMWECPDFFELDGKAVIFVSPQDMLPEGFEYHNGNGTLCLIGTYDPASESFIEQRNQAVDYGIDFYAMQTLLTPDGRRVMIGWMQNWDACNTRDAKPAWFGQMSLPRELSIKNGRLYQQPVRELQRMWCNKVERRGITFTGAICLDGIRGRQIDMQICVRPEEGAELYNKFAVRFAKNDSYRTALSFRPGEGLLRIDRKFSGSRRAVIHQRRAYVGGEDGRLKLRLILDRFSAEVFVNDGVQVLSVTIYTEQEADEIEFFTDGRVTMDVLKYDLRSY